MDYRIQKFKKRKIKNKVKFINSLFEIEKDYEFGYWTKENFWDVLFKEKRIFAFIVYDNKTIIGYMICKHYGKRIMIYNIALKKEYRGKGIGTKLLDILLNDDRIEKINLQVHTENLEAIKFYLRKGFIPEYKLLNYYEKNEDAYFMSLNKSK